MFTFFVKRDKYVRETFTRFLICREKYVRALRPEKFCAWKAAIRKKLGFCASGQDYKTQEKQENVSDKQNYEVQDKKTQQNVWDTQKYGGQDYKTKEKQEQVCDKQKYGVQDDESCEKRAQLWDQDHEAESKIRI